MLQWPVDADNTLVPPEVQEAFERVRSGADFMPAQQMEVSTDASLLVHTVSNQCKRVWCSLSSLLQAVGVSPAVMGCPHSVIAVEGMQGLM